MGHCIPSTLATAMVYPTKMVRFPDVLFDMGSVPIDSFINAGERSADEKICSSRHRAVRWRNSRVAHRVRWLDQRREGAFDHDGQHRFRRLQNRCADRERPATGTAATRRQPHRARSRRRPEHPPDRARSTRRRPPIRRSDQRRIRRGGRRNERPLNDSIRIPTPGGRPRAAGWCAGTRSPSAVRRRLSR